MATKCIDVDSADHLYLAGEAMIPVHNCLGDTQYAKYTTGGPSETYKTQAHTYGLGFSNLGFEVNTVGIVFLGRAKMLKDMHIWSEPFDKLRALKAIRRFVKLQSIMAARIDGVPTDPMRIEATPGGQCFFCQSKSATPDGSDGYCCEKPKKGKS